MWGEDVPYEYDNNSTDFLQDWYGVDSADEIEDAINDYHYDFED